MVQETHTHKSVVVRYTLQLHTHAMAAHAVSATAAAETTAASAPAAVDAVAARDTAEGSLNAAAIASTLCRLRACGLTGGATCWPHTTTASGGRSRATDCCRHALPQPAAGHSPASATCRTWRSGAEQLSQVLAAPPRTHLFAPLFCAAATGTSHKPRTRSRSCRSRHLVPCCAATSHQVRSQCIAAHGTVSAMRTPAQPL